MTAVHLRADEPFYSQWSSRGGRARSLESSRALRELLDFSPPLSLAVVGSKGKGTAAAAASMTLSYSGLTTVSITSPALRTNRERIRLNGQAISLAEYDRISARLATLLPLLPSETYLSPSGAYTLMGAWWGADIGADVLVIEEGMGGASDEVSLFDHTALAVTLIFLEHAGILGNDLEEIANNLVGAGSDSVRFVGSATQSSDVERLVRSAAETWNASLVFPAPAVHRNPLIGENIGLGVALARAFAASLGKQAHGVEHLNLPGRSSLHEGPTGRWFVDGAISPEGVRAALNASCLTDPTIIVSWPLSKDRNGCSELVPGAIHTRIPHLDYPPGLPTFAEVVDTLSGDVVALGTISFVAEVVDHLKAPTNLW